MGASALLIIFIVLMGYISNRYSQAKHHKLLQFSGQHLYNKLVVNGVACFVLGLLYCNLVDYWAPGLFRTNEYLKALNILGPSFDETVFSALVTGLGLSLLWSLAHDLLQQAIFQSQADKPHYQSNWWIVQRIESWKRYVNYVRHNEAASSDPIRAQVLHSVTSSGLTMIFMSDRKVYIGRFESALFSNDFREQLTHCKFVPIKSGFREKDTLEVSITTEYKITPSQAAALQPGPLSVILKISDIVSIRDYSEEQFAYFLEKKASKVWNENFLNIAVENGKLSIGCLESDGVASRGVSPQPGHGRGAR